MPSSDVDLLKSLMGEIRIATDSASVTAEIPERVTVAGSRLVAAPDPADAPPRHTATGFINAFAHSAIEVFLGDRGDQLAILAAAFYSLVVSRIGLGPDSGVHKPRPHNSRQVAPAAIALLTAVRRSTRVAALVDRWRLDPLPRLLGQLALRCKLRTEAVQHLADLDRAVTETLVEIDTLVRPTIPMVRPLAVGSMQLVLEPLLALVQEPADKAQETLRVLEEGRARGLAEAAAAAPRPVAPSNPSPAVIVVPTAAPASSADPPPPPARRGRRG